MYSLNPSCNILKSHHNYTRTHAHTSAALHRMACCSMVPHLDPHLRPNRVMVGCPSGAQDPRLHLPRDARGIREHQGLESGSCSVKKRSVDHRVS